MYCDGLGRLYLYLYLFAFMGCVFVLLLIFRRIKVYIMGRLRRMTLECERCGLVLHMSRVSWSVCLVCVCVGRAKTVGQIVSPSGAESCAPMHWK